MMSLTPEQFRRTGLGVVPSPSPFFTPRPEKRRVDLRGSEWSVNRLDKEKEVNVQVLLRCRPLNDEEQRMNVSKVISCNESKREVTVLQNLANKQVDRVFTFDKVFGPKAQQRSIYDQSIAPIVNEVLEGYNCTIFAYGQTGTGKTYTMEGGMRKKASELPAEAGVIPRAVRHIFDILESQNADYSMKVTFLELYNEEITDLLASDDSPRSFEDRQRRPISLMEDGKGCVVVRGLEEVAVYSANEIYTLLDQGAAKRRTVDTLLNKRSSRSHSVFSIAVYIKEATVGEEELIKCGKLNLVDLAGSENISRSGAREGRAKEAGEINKSLLTLGRVINALVEHSPHIPYRDSKLTRILRDSLGGKTKTCIIATISPSAHCLEETLSTLDYAHRAKNIKNKPEANQKMSKAVLLKDLYLEMEKLKEDIRAAREKNGVYIPHDRFAQEEAEKKAQNERIEELESSLVLCEKEVAKFRELYNIEQEKKMDLESELKNCKVELEKSSSMLLDLQEKYRLAISTIEEKEFVISKFVQSENSLIERAKELRGDLQQASDDIGSLFRKLDRKDMMETDNHNLLLTFGSQIDQSLKNLHKTIIGSVSQQQHQIRCMEEQASLFLASKDDATKVLRSKVQKMMETHDLGVTALTDFVNTLQNNAMANLEHLSSSVSSQAKAMENIMVTLAIEAKEVISSIQNSLCEQKELLAFSAQQQEEGLRRGVISAQLISKATVDFFNDLQNQTSEVMAILEKNHIQKSEQLTKFEKIFKEETAREEKQALDQVAAILSNFTSARTKRVAEAAKSIHQFNTQEKQRLHEEISNMQKVSNGAKKEMIEYMITTDNKFIEDTISAAESHTIMETCLQECSKVVDCSRQQWDSAESAINGLNQRGIKKINHEIRENIKTYNHSHEEFVSLSTSMDKDFRTRVDNAYNAINDSQARDHDCKEKMDSMATVCFDQLHTTQEQHGQNILKIRTRAEQCLTKEYLVDQSSGATPKKQTITVPSLASIEELRMSMDVNLKGEDILENISKYEQLDCKSSRLLHEEVSLHRTPFADIN